MASTIAMTPASIVSMRAEHSAHEDFAPAPPTAGGPACSSGLASSVGMGATGAWLATPRKASSSWPKTMGGRGSIRRDDLCAVTDTDRVHGLSSTLEASDDESDAPSEAAPVQLASLRVVESARSLDVAKFIQREECALGGARAATPSLSSPTIWRLHVITHHDCTHDYTHLQACECAGRQHARSPTPKPLAASPAHSFGLRSITRDAKLSKARLGNGIHKAPDVRVINGLGIGNENFLLAC